MQSSKMQSIRKLFAHQERQEHGVGDQDLAAPAARRPLPRLPHSDMDRAPTPSFNKPARSDTSSDSMHSRGSKQDGARVASAQSVGPDRTSPLLPPLPQRFIRGKTAEIPGVLETFPQHDPVASVDDQEQRDALGALPVATHHRRNDSGLIMQDGAAVYVPDYSSNASSSSGFLSRGTSTASTGRSEARYDSKRQSLSSWGDQQDFFLEALRPDRLQRLQLLVSVPHHVLLLYQDLYERDFSMGETSAHERIIAPQRAHGSSLLLHERNTAPERFMVTRSTEDSMRQAYINVLATQDGNKRLCRFLRWALQADVREQSMVPAYDLDQIPALSALEIRALLEPLQLSPVQASRLRKHCRSLPLRSVNRVGFGSSFSFQYP